MQDLDKLLSFWKVQEARVLSRLWLAVKEARKCCFALDFAAEVALGFEDACTSRLRKVNFISYLSN